jgi:hypothetical protein
MKEHNCCNRRLAEIHVGERGRDHVIVSVVFTFGHIN